MVIYREADLQVGYKLVSSFSAELLAGYDSRGLPGHTTARLLWNSTDKLNDVGTTRLKLEISKKDAFQKFRKLIRQQNHFLIYREVKA